MYDFTITSQVTYPEFRQLQFRMMYAKRWTQIISVLGILFTIAFLYTLTLDDYYVMDEPWSGAGIFFITMAIYAPISAHFSIKKSFKNSLRLQERITYHFSEQGVENTGESFTGTFSWDKLYQVKTIKGWLLTYQSARVFNPIKLNEQDYIHLPELKSFLQSEHPNVKVKM
ncbi:hypothetical protein KHS38_05295 [Mucilaginibacter sp. Bleaf8]|uniref:hypothetical protein n=1 Tax=Mucilaginibacter sp. Bleaf8 TaxID=2834430 RepID=UPI001BCFE536|nr:hypothetical protein [Mucilaginibacter sp. Bleaf8]MBS7563811.1 hypothetical protein [Mucilaginibacter sp. Bleaf8]